MDDLQHVNPYIQIYKTARERLAEYQNRSTPHSVYLTGTLQLVTEQGLDKRRFNLPTSNEVAALIPDQPDYGPKPSRDVALSLRAAAGTSGTRRITPLNPNYIPLHYVILFPHGDPGWHWDLEYNSESNRARKRMSMRAFYAYRIFCRYREFGSLFYTTRLFQQFLVDV